MLVRVLTLLLVLAATARAQARIEDMLRPEFAVRDETSAGKFAEDYAYRVAPTVGKPYKARVLVLTRAPRQLGKEFRAEPVWIVLVQNAAESDIVPTPLALLCVRARDGKVLNLASND